MESLSDILRSLPAQPAGKSPEAGRQALLADPILQKWRERHPGLDDRTLKLNLNRLYQYVSEYRNCSNCPGLERCPNDLAGHYTRLNVEIIQEQAQIHDAKVSCKKWLNAQKEQALRSRIRSFYVDETALNRAYSFRDIVEKDLERAAAVERMMDYIELTKEHGLQQKGLYLAGPFGTGKTFMMCYMLHELAASGFSGLIVYMPDFAEDLKSMFHEQGKIKETVELMKETDLLVFDDIGAENMNPWLRDHVMGSILNYRMNRKPTFYTSNYMPEALEQHFSFTDKEGAEENKGRRIMERIHHFVDLIEVNGSNKRGEAG